MLDCLIDLSLINHRLEKILLMNEKSPLKNVAMQEADI